MGQTVGALSGRRAPATAMRYRAEVRTGAAAGQARRPSGRAMPPRFDAEPGMTDTNNTFKKAPKRKPAKGKSVSVSPEMRQAYADLIRERAEKQEAYGRHLPQDESRRR
ncbi:hypothetical protein SAMN05216360_108210 [Methylobacterium phyllostachyos]|uniref:Uncharacterized protein n=2 Tax=Methylobacterium phyllostachyos TaxID=582672 RepID=A0A1H0BKQ9_9HYPH|nr:hypothetical protein SAMN05216360_108210 [Methylobacterium phyllostachyos]